MGNELSSLWMKSFPELVKIVDPVWQRAMRAARIVSLERGKVVNCGNEPLFILSGSISIRDATRCGHELALCKVRSGQVCWLNLAVVTGEVDYPQGLTVLSESDGYAAIVSRSSFEEALSCREFRAFVFRELFRGLKELRNLVENVAFGQMNRRVARSLLDSAKDGRTVATTHSNIALELGTAREVVSRQLKQFERNGWVYLRRGQIVINDKVELQRIVEMQ